MYVLNSKCWLIVVWQCSMEVPARTQSTCRTTYHSKTLKQHDSSLLLPVTGTAVTALSISIEAVISAAKCISTSTVVSEATAISPAHPVAQLLTEPLAYSLAQLLAHLLEKLTAQRFLVCACSLPTTYADARTRSWARTVPLLYQRALAASFLCA